MRFLNFGIVALSSLFAATSAAPTLTQELPAIKDINLEQPSVDTILNRRTDDVVCQKLSTTLVEVKKHTTIINSTISSVDGTTDKSEIISTVKHECTIIIQLVTSLVGDITVLLTDITTITGDVKDEVVGLVLELLLEILMTLNGVITHLKISEFS